MEVIKSRNISVENRNIIENMVHHHDNITIKNISPKFIGYQVIALRFKYYITVRNDKINQVLILAFEIDTLVKMPLATCVNNNELQQLDNKNNKNSAIFKKSKDELKVVLSINTKCKIAFCKNH